MRELNDRLRDHLDDAAPPVDVDRLVRYLVAAGRTDDMRVSTLEPELKTPPPTRRRMRIGLVFVGAVVVTIVAVGFAGRLFGGAETTGEPGTVPPTVELTVPPATSPDATADVTSPPTTAEDPQVTTTATIAPQPLPQAVVVPIDPGVEVDWAQPSIALRADGTPLLLYERDRGTVAYAACDGPECADPSVTSVLEVGGSIGWLIGTPRPETGPVFWAQKWLGGGGESIVSALVMCNNAACDDPDVISLRESEHGVGRPGLAVTPEGAPVMIWSDMVEPAGIMVMSCSDPSCSGGAPTRRVWTADPDQWVSGGSAAAIDGPPVVTFRGSDSLFIGTCRHSHCDPGELATGFDALVEIPLPGAPYRDPRLVIRPDGSPTAVVLVENGIAEDVVAVACESPQCLDPVVTVLGTMADTYGEWDIAMGNDGRLRVAWTQDGALFLATCADASCSVFEVVELTHPARDVAIAVDADGHPVIATSNPDRGVELLICADEPCSFAP